MHALRVFSRLGVILGLAVAVPAVAQEMESSAGPLRISAVATGLTEPWGMAFLPDGALLVTERDGRLVMLRDGAAQPVSGLPQVWVEGQGGLLDVMVPADFATSREIWLTYATEVAGGGATAVGKGRLSEDGTVLEGFTQLWVGKGVGGGRHFGSRLAEGADGTVYLTTGDRGTGPGGLAAQDPMRPEGKVIALNRDGGPAVTLPGFAPGVFSLGHRNAQGLTFDAQTGTLWLVEHGAKGGDEVNRVETGQNYGWPVISYGVNYNGAAIGEGQDKPGMQQPLHYWDPSIAPSGLMVYRGDLFPAWEGDMFTGSLNSDFLSRLDPEAGFAEERLAAPQTGRVRDVIEAPDGSIWFLSVIDGAVYRIDPAG
jgi:glucose/arabinose dehydrogenase